MSYSDSNYAYNCNVLEIYNNWDLFSLPLKDCGSYSISFDQNSKKYYITSNDVTVESTKLDIKCIEFVRANNIDVGDEKEVFLENNLKNPQ